MSSRQSNFALLDVHDVESEPSSSEDEAGPATPGGSGLGTPLSKKARARRRATERRQARKLGISLDQVSESPQSNNPPAPLTPPQAETQSEPTYAQVAEPEKPAATNVSEEPKQKQAHIPEVNVPNSQPLLQLEPAAQIQTRGQLTEADAEVSSVTSSSSDSEDEPLPAPSEEKSLGTERRIESPQTPRRNKSREQAPPSKDHQPGSKWRSIITRTIWTFIMVGGFITLTLMGHAYVVIIIFFVQLQVFRELSHLFEAGAGKSSSSHSHSHSEAYIAAKEKKRIELVRYSRIITWYFFAVFNYFLYGEVIIYYFKHIVLVDAHFVPFVRHHRFISFCLYTLGFVGFVGTLRRDALKTQFGLFAWVHISLFLVILSSHFMVNNIFEGLIWFWIPVSLVICNDIWAYICGMLFGRTQLIQLSPKKTVEGFVGALFCTVIFGYFWGTLFMRFPYFICPCSNLGMSFFTDVQCQPNPVFLWHYLPLPDWLSAGLRAFTGFTISHIPWASFQIHVAMMAVFASLVAPFGGFFASGFKRAFNIKDFGDSIPGHGGMTDRMDCQFLMGIFSYVYYSSLVRQDAVSVASLLETAIAALSREDQLLLLENLSAYIKESTPIS